MPTPNIVVSKAFTITALSTGSGFSSASDVGVSISPSGEYFLYAGQTMNGGPVMTVTLSQTNIANDTATIAGCFITALGATTAYVKDDPSKGTSSSTGTLSPGFGINMVAAGSTSSLTMTAINLSVVPASPVSGASYEYVGVAVGAPFASAADAQWEQTAPSQGYNSGWEGNTGAVVVSLSADGYTATVTGLASGSTIPHTAQMKSVSTGVLSPIVTYSILATAPTNTMTAILATVVPNPVIASQAYDYVGVAVGAPWPSVADVEWEQTIPLSGNYNSGWLTNATNPATPITLSPDGYTATVTGFVSGILNPHTAQFKSASTGVLSNIVTYSVITAPTTETVHLAYSDGTTETLTGKAAGVSLSSVVILALTQQTTVYLSDGSTEVTTNPYGTTVTATYTNP